MRVGNRKEWRCKIYTNYIYLINKFIQVAFELDPFSGAVRYISSF